MSDEAISEWHEIASLSLAMTSLYSMHAIKIAVPVILLPLESLAPGFLESFCFKQKNAPPFFKRAPRRRSMTCRKDGDRNHLSSFREVVPVNSN
jgi:hypothetical protein